jgi:hypothetical protein
MTDTSHEDLLTAFIADQSAPPTSDPAPIRSMDGPTLGRLARRGLPWILGGGVVYLLAPSVLGVLAASDQLVEIDWYWLLALLVAQAAVLYLTWVLQRLLIDGGSGTRTPLPLIASTQLVGRPAPRPRCAPSPAAGWTPAAPPPASSPSRSCRWRPSARSRSSARSW